MNMLEVNSSFDLGKIYALVYVEIVLCNQMTMKCVESDPRECVIKTT